MTQTALATRHAAANTSLLAPPLAVTVYRLGSMRTRPEGDQRHRQKGQLHGMGRWEVAIALRITVIRDVAL